MKKLVLLSLLVSVFAFGYTQTDTSNAQFLADQWVIVKQSTTAGYRLDSTITRAEAIGIALKIKWVALPSYQCKWYFSDVRNNDWICRAVELGADGGLVSRTNAAFRPNDKITRAEALAILIKSWNIQFNKNSYCEKYAIPDTDFGCGAFGLWEEGLQDWQLNIFLSYHGGVLNKGLSDLLGTVRFRANENSTRAEVFGFVKNILWNEKLTNTNMNCEIEGVKVYGECKIDHGDIRYGKYIEAPVYWDNLYQWPECAISYENQGSYIIWSPKPGKYGNIEYIDMSYLENWMRIVPGNSGYYEISSPWDIDNCMDVSLWDIRKLTIEDVFGIYYGNLDKSRNMRVEAWAYRMRSPAWVSEETFFSWYKNVTSVVFRENTMKNLWDNTYEFLVDMTESGVKSTYKVKSKVDLENFKINNISSVKQ